MTGEPLSDKSKVVAGLLQLLGLLGIVGIGRIYLGYTGLGVAQLIIGLVTCGIGAIIWGIVDAVLILTERCVTRRAARCVTEPDRRGHGPRWSRPFSVADFAATRGRHHRTRSASTFPQVPRAVLPTSGWV